MLDIEQYVNEGILFDGHYQLIQPLSTDGGTADVWLARDVNTIDNDIDGVADEEMLEETGMLVAIKIYRPKNALDIEGEQRFRDEYKIVYDCRHTNLLQPTSFSIFEEVPYLVMPFCERGSSAALIGQLTDEAEIWRFIHDVASGLAYLHANTPQIIHQDIKPGNILVDNNGNFAITDFGISTRQGNYHGYYDEENCGTMAYMAPERFDDSVGIRSESDIWAFGATLYELLTGNVPFGEDGGSAQLQGVEYTPVPGLSPDLQRLLSACLSQDMTKRPTASEIEKSAEVHQYPIKKKSKLPLIIGIIVLILGIGAAAFFLLKQKEDEKQKVEEKAAQVEQKVAQVEKENEELKKNGGVPAIPIEEAFAEALRYANMTNSDSLRYGMQLLDSIGRLDYIPALFEEVKTYGWYSDPISLQRKDLLGIKYYMDGENDYLPVSDEINNKAVAYLNRIIELKNTNEFVGMTAHAYYRLACYYCNTDKVYKNDEEKAKSLLLDAKRYAEQAQDKELVNRVERNLQVFEEEYEYEDE